MSDPAKYRTREEVDSMRKQHDPIDQLKEMLVREGIEESALKELDREVKQVVTKATDFALTSPLPAADELYTDILVDHA